MCGVIRIGALGINFWDHIISLQSDGTVALRAAPKNNRAVRKGLPGCFLDLLRRGKKSPVDPEEGKRL